MSEYIPKVIKEAKAEAWDEAVNLARSYSFIGFGDDMELKRENPYRENE